MEEKQTYIEIANAILKDKVRVFGPLAIQKASETNGLVISEGGEIVDITTPPKSTISNLLQKLEEIGGSISTILAKNSIYKIVQQHPSIDLPVELK